MFAQRGWEQHREPSDVSVEALDLADYARTLAQTGNARSAPVFQPVFQAYDSYPPSPQGMRPLASRDSFSPPPVLSPSSTTSHSSHGSAAPLRPHHRPFSLPPPTASPPRRFETLLSHPSASSRSSYPAPYDPDPLLTPPDLEQEVDISQFPRFTRGWYKPPQAGYFEPAAPYALPEVDPFDPKFLGHDHESYPTLPRYSSQLPSHASHSSRDLVPWGPDAPEGAPIDEEIKAERLRMLEREFGKDAKPEVDEEHLVGSVDARGRLITEGPKKRMAVRCLQVLLALLAGGSGIYSAAVRGIPCTRSASSRNTHYYYSS